ncbi:unnamed protein product, partial [Rotaria magnacalcarata]
KRIRYQLLDENDDEGAYDSTEKKKEKSRFFTKNKTNKSNIVISASDQSDENGEQTLYDKPLLTAKASMNSPNLRNRGLTVAVQDSNGIPVCDNVQSQKSSEHVSNEVPEQPVLSPVSGCIFEKRLIVKYLHESPIDPVNGQPLIEEQLIDVK